jgi:hypothetical protein
MSMRVLIGIAIAAMIAFGFMAWNISIQMTPAPSAAGSGSQGAPAGGEPAPGGGEPAPGGAMPGGGEVAAPEAGDPGLAWDVPKHWTIDLAQGMRIATYLVPAAGGAGAECAVYYFGPGQGGGVEANLERWMGEFQPLDKHDTRKLTPGGLTVTRISASGNYVAHSMKSGASAGEKPDWALLGGIVNGPQGDVFFKLTGPKATVNGAARDFDAMLGSLRKK